MRLLPSSTWWPPLQPRTGRLSILKAPCEWPYGVSIYVYVFIIYIYTYLYKRIYTHIRFHTYIQHGPQRDCHFIALRPMYMYIYIYTMQLHMEPMGICFLAPGRCITPQKAGLDHPTALQQSRVAAKHRS